MDPNSANTMSFGGGVIGNLSTAAQDHRAYELEMKTREEIRRREPHNQLDMLMTVLRCAGTPADNKEAVNLLRPLVAAIVARAGG